MAGKVESKAVARQSVADFTVAFINSAKGEYSGINTVVTKHKGYNYNQWYKSYHSRGLLEVGAPESPVDATKALESKGIVVLGRGRPTGAYMVLAADSYRNSERKQVSALDALTI